MLMKIIAADQVVPSSIVTCGALLQGGCDVPVVAVLVFALDCVDRNSIVLAPGRRDVVLRRKRIRWRHQQQIGPSGLERLGQIWLSWP